MKLYKYKNYDEYVKWQKAGYEKKKKNIWVKRANVEKICEYLKGFPHELGICHGVRAGYEQKYFMDFMDCEVIGTEIGNIDIPNTVQWDFNIQKAEWIGKFDFLYSNSFDHAYQPRRTLQTWAEQVKRGGHIVIEYDQRNEHTGEISKKINKIDPVSITVQEISKLFPQWIDCDIKIISLPEIVVGFQKAIIMRIK